MWRRDEKKRGEWREGERNNTETQTGGVEHATREMFFLFLDLIFLPTKTRMK